MIHNICKFNATQTNAGSDSISILNFVYEKEFDNPHYIAYSAYRLYMVVKGEGYIDTFNSRKALQTGDVFLTEPATSYCITNTNELELLYVSFIGLKMDSLLKRIDLPGNGALRNRSDLLPFWTAAFELAVDSNVDLIAESILLYTFGAFSIKDDHPESDEYKKHVLKIKKQVEDRFSDPSLELRTLCRENYYNPKYMSRVFAKYMGVTFSEYLLQLRLNNSIRLIERGLTSVKEIAFLSGFSDASYFTRVFKKTTSKTPTQYICEIANKK